MPPKSSRRLVSFVFPVYNEEGNIALLHERMSTVVAQRPDLDIEFIYVNDGSRDRSFELLRGLAEADERVMVLDLSRNFGHQLAVTAGVDAASGDAVIIMDTDLQDPPEVCLELLAAWEEGWDVVYAQRRSRKDGVFKRFTAAVFYRVLRILADIDIPRDTGDFRLIDKTVADQLRAMREHHRFLRGMVSFVGFRQTAVQFDRDERHSGTTGYPFRKMVSFALDGILSFSRVPLTIISRVGMLLAALSFAAGIYVFISKLVAPELIIEGWAFIVICILLVGGVQLIMLGVLGAYLGRLYTEAQGRPLYIVRETVRRPVTRNRG